MDSYAHIRGDIKGFLNVGGMEFLVNLTGSDRDEHFVRGKYNATDFAFILPQSADDGILRGMTNASAERGAVHKELIKAWKKNSRYVYMILLLL